MRVAIIGGAMPYPATSGSRIRTLSLMVRLARRHQLTFLCAWNPDRIAASQALAYLAEHQIKTIEVDHVVPPKSGLSFYARLAANLLSPLPYSVAAYTGPAFRKAVEQLAERGEIDLWQAEWVGGMEAIRSLKGVPKLVMAHNVESQIWERSAAAETHPLKRIMMRDQFRKYHRFECNAFAAANRVVAVSLNDAALIHSRFGVSNVDVVDNGIDRAFFQSVVPKRDPRRLLFLGSLDWRPNLDALGVFLDQIFPAVRASEPEARLEIVGRNPPQSLVKRAAATAGVMLHADVADVRPFLANAGVMPVPLRIGGGSRLKILEALATALPVISTRVGAEGLSLDNGTHLEIADDPGAITSAIIAAIREPARVQAMAQMGQTHVLERYDWDALAVLVERCWDACLAEHEVASFAVGFNHPLPTQEHPPLASAGPVA